MSLIWRSLPPDWPAYTDRAGHAWRLAGNGYWWLRYGEAWYQADSPSARSVLGVPVPVLILAEHRNLLTPDSFTEFGQRILSSFGTPPAYLYHIGAGSSGASNTVFADGPASPAVPGLPPAPNIPPDFAEIPLGPDCCRKCHLDDGPLYEGGLCRYCWMLSHVPVRPTAALARRETSGWENRTATVAAALVLLLALFIAVFGYG